MRDLPEFVKWEDDSITNEVRNRVIAKYGIKGLNSGVDMSGLSFEELIDLATFASDMGYSSELCSELTYESQKSLKEKLNVEFDFRIGEMLEIYNLFDKKFNKEQWSGNVRFQLLSLHNRKGYSEMGVLKNCVWFSKLKGKEICIETAPELNLVMSSSLYWAFGHEVRSVDFEVSKENFEICNNGRKLEIEAQNNFVRYVFEGNYDEAFKMIEHQIKNKLILLS